MGGLWVCGSEAFWMSLCLPRDGRDAWRRIGYWMVWILLQWVVSSRCLGLRARLLGYYDPKQRLGEILSANSSYSLAYEGRVVFWLCR